MIEFDSVTAATAMDVLSHDEIGEGHHGLGEAGDSHVTHGNRGGILHVPGQCRVSLLVCNKGMGMGIL